MSESLWPQPIEIIGLTGEYASGKTLFGLTIDPKNTLVWDEEKSSASYTSLGFERRDLFAQLDTKSKFGVIDVYLSWLSQVDALPVGKFTVGMLDTVGMVEAGLADWVSQHPANFGHTNAQYQKMNGVYWGDVKQQWKFVLNRVASKFQTFCFTSHLGTVWKNGEPTGKRKPKGKDTLMELASLYLQMERKADLKGNLPAKPAATVLKSRLMSHRINEATGEIEIVPSLPPRLPIATPHSIRQYMIAPPDYSKLSDEERIREEVMTEEEKLQLQTARAVAERDTEMMRSDRAAKEQAKADAKREMAERVKAKTGERETPAAKPTTEPKPAAKPAETAATTEPTKPVDAPKSEAKESKARLSKYERLREYKKLLGMSDEQYKAALAKRGVASAKELDDLQLDELCTKLSTMITARQIFHGEDGKNGHTDTKSDAGTTHPAFDPNANLLPDGKPY